MHLTPIKSATELKLNGVAVEFNTEGDSVKEIVLSSHGQRFVLKPGESYSQAIKIFRADKFKMEKRHVLGGEFVGLTVDEAFESKFDAEQRKNELARKGDASGLTITEKEVPVDAGVAVKAATADLDMPF